MTILIITSQDFIDEEIVAQKIASGDFEVSLSPEFKVGGDERPMRVILDGHHSYAAAIAAGETPIYNEMTAAQHDAVGLLMSGDVDDFLAAVHMGADYFEFETGRSVW